MQEGMINWSLSDRKKPEIKGDDSIDQQLLCAENNHLVYKVVDLMP